MPHIPHPLSIFPQLLTFGLLAPTILRLTASYFLTQYGLERLGKKYKWAGVLYFISALFILLGFYTQIAAIVGIIILKADFYIERRIKTLSPDQKKLYFVIVTVLLSLLFTGPGFLALDLPL